MVKKEKIHKQLWSGSSTSYAAAAILEAWANVLEEW